MARAERAEGGRLSATCCALLVVAYVLLNLPIIASKPDNFDQVKVFSVDEYGICKSADFLVHTGSFTERGRPETAGPGGENATCSTRPYGQLYSLLIAAPLLVLQPFVAVDEFLVVRNAVIVLVISGLVVLLATYAAASRLYDARYGTLAAVLVLITPEFLRWSNEIHPDLPQLAGLMAGFYFAVRTYELAIDRPGRALLYGGLASACAGLAMAAKFNGIFLLPVIAVACNRGVATATSGSRLRPYLARNIGWGFVCLVAFVAVFAFCSPCLVANPDLALEPFSRSAAMSIGKMQAQQSLWARFLGVVASNRVLAESTIGYGAYVLLLLALAFAAWRLLSHPREELSSPRILAEVYIVPFLTYSLLLGYGLTDGRLPAGYERYLLPVVPVMYIAALRIVAAAVQAAPGHRRAAVVAVALVLLIGQAPLVQRFGGWYTDFRLRKEMGFFKVHDWVLDHVPKGSKIYTEFYIYVPTEDYVVVRDYAIASRPKMMENDYIITKTLDYEVYRDAERWRLYEDRPVMVHSRRIYEDLEHGRLPAFERLARLSAGDAFAGNDAVVVYRNVASTWNPTTRTR